MAERDWTSWWQSDIPCQFSQNEAAENRVFLTKMLGASFVARASERHRSSAHPLLQRWRTDGASAFIELNALADDLRVVEHANGLQSVIQDFKNPATCYATWHTIHMAALITRSNGIRLVRFFPQTSETLPDFLIDTGSAEVACEAKLLEQSGDSKRVARYAEALSKAVIDKIDGENVINPAMTIVLRDANNIPDLDSVCGVALDELARFTGNQTERRTVQFNIFLERTPFAKGFVKAFSGCQIMCPRSDNETIRVHSRSSKASKQLRSSTTAHLPGILMLGVTEYQEPADLITQFRRRFAAGQYTGISEAILVKRNVHLDRPLRTLVDSVAAIPNPSTTTRVPSVQLGTVGAIATLVGLPTGAIPAYGHILMKVKARGPGKIGFPDARVLTVEALRGPD